jgi:hypothetical protein
MPLHHGHTLEKIIRRDGHSISEVAKKLNVNRRSIYNWFNHPVLRQEIIFKIGHALLHDFSIEVPELFKPSDFNFEVQPAFSAEAYESQNQVKTDEMESLMWREKYLKLLKKYNDLKHDWNPGQKFG